MSRSLIGISLALGALALSTTACQDVSWPEGHSCTSNAECALTLCLAGTCRDPQADEDGDGLSNAIELALGTDPLYFDSDYDQLSDGEEVGDPNAPTDTDGDGMIDALENALADHDLDCIRDPYDPDDQQPEIDMNRIRDANCRREGVCGAHLKVISVTCDVLEDNGEKIAIATCDYSEVPGYEEDPELQCDGFDNDCDGSIDEALGYIQENGDVRTLGQTCLGVGACSNLEGVVECGRDLNVTCSINFQGSQPSGEEELPCDNVDNDCNGIVDDGVFWLDPNTGLRRTVGEPCDGRGLCGLGTVECSANGSVGVCSTELGGSNDESLPEICDGYDNDCDGDIDESQTYEEEGESLALGAACGFGACAGGEVVCKDGVAACSTSAKASDGAELCNGIDDDCDGETDEPEGLEAYCSTKGVCLSLAVLAVNCEANEPLPVCSYEEAIDLELGSEESCDGLDNDCDGEADEGLFYTDDAGKQYPIGSFCPGLGACAQLDEGIVECTADGGVQCTANAQGGTSETCNGKDDDCDGVIDEVGPNDEPPGLCSQEGICQFLANVPASCTDGQWKCPYTELDTFEEHELSCDGLDNDCDGMVDEGTLKQLTGNVTEVFAGQPSERRRWLITPETQGQGLLFGGWNQTAKSVPVMLGDFWRYEVGQRLWTSLPQGPPPRAGHAASFDTTHGVYLLHGGVKDPVLEEPFETLEGIARSDMWLFEISSNTWSQVTQDWSMIPGASPISRRGHTLTAVGNGVFILHGGVTNGNLMPARVTLKATLKPIGANGGWLCFWEVVDSGAGHRVRHSAIFDELNQRVVIVGGKAPNGAKQPFLELLTLVDGGLDSIDSVDLTPPNRLYPAVVAQGNVAIIHGGEAPSPGGENALSPKNDTFLLDLTTDTLVKITPEKTPDAMQGASLLSAWVGTVDLVGGTGIDGFSTRKSWKLAISDLSWSEPEAWKGPIPRSNAALVGSPWSADLWLVGGELATYAGTKHLFDAWKYEAGAEEWKTITTPEMELPEGLAAFPSKVAALFEPSHERVLMIGENLPAGVLLSFKPKQGAFEIIDTEGSVPPAMTSMTLMLGPEPHIITLTGIFMGKGYVYTLNLDTMKWSPVVTQGTGPTQSKYMAAGLNDQTVITLSVQKDASLNFRSLDLNTQVWTDLGTIIPPTGIQKLVSFGFDEASEQGLILLQDSENVVKTWVADFKIPALFPIEPWWPLEETGSAFVFHPELGAVSVGGRSQKGHTTSATYSFEQICSP